MTDEERSEALNAAAGNLKKNRRISGCAYRGFYLPETQRLRIAA